MSGRLPLSELGLATGKRARLHRILYRHGLGNGTAMFLPCDQGLEHGPRDFFTKPAAADPAYIVRLAVEGGFNGVAMQVGAVAALAGRALVVFSGGAMASDEAVLTRTREAMQAGATGVIYGRNIWQRDHGESLGFADRLRDILARYRAVHEDP